jgi:hypothetical protein
MGYLVAGIDIHQKVWRVVVTAASTESCAWNVSEPQFRSPKGNRFVRRIPTQAAQAAVKKNGSFWQRTFRRWLPELGYPRAIWAIAHKLCRLVWKVLH